MTHDHRMLLHAMQRDEQPVEPANQWAGTSATECGYVPSSITGLVPEQVVAMVCRKPAVVRLVIEFDGIRQWAAACAEHATVAETCPVCREGYVGAELVGESP